MTEDKDPLECLKEALVMPHASMKTVDEVRMARIVGGVLHIAYVALTNRELLGDEYHKKMTLDEMVIKAIGDAYDAKEEVIPFNGVHDDEDKINRSLVSGHGGSTLGFDDNEKYEVITHLEGPLSEIVMGPYRNLQAHNGKNIPFGKSEAFSQAAGAISHGISYGLSGEVKRGDDNYVATAVAVATQRLLDQHERDRDIGQYFRR